LTAVGFRTTTTLTPVSASIDGSSVWYGSITDVGDGWGYSSTINFHGFNSGISATGAFSGLGHSNFSAADNALDGLDYGILSAGDNSATGNPGVTGHGPLIKDSVVFTLSAPGFLLSDLGASVSFQYGTASTETSYYGYPPTGRVPVPATLLLFGSGLAALGWKKRRAG